MLLEISCWQDFILIFSKGHNSRKGDNSNMTKIRISYFSMSNPIWNFKTLACTVHKIWHTCDFILIFSKGHTSMKGDNSDKKITMCVNYFSTNPYMKLHYPSIYGSKDMACIKKCLKQTHARTDRQPGTNMPLQLLWSWGHNKGHSKMMIYSI